MNRRQFVGAALRTGATGLGVGLAASTMLSGCAPGTIDGVDHVPLASALGADAIRALGRAYMQATPGERDASALTRALQAAAREARDYPWSPTPTASDLVARDFTAGRTVFVDGWLLSANEARQCALFALAAA